MALQGSMSQSEYLEKQQPGGTRSDYLVDCGLLMFGWRLERGEEMNAENRINHASFCSD